MTPPANLIFFQSDNHETRDLARESERSETMQRLEAKLRAICDPEAVDGRAKADQRAMVERVGGIEKVKSESQILFTPPPGVSKEEAWAVPTGT